jgi:hypothetical protein
MSLVTANHVKSEVKELRLGNVRIVDRIVSKAEVAKLLSEADVLIRARSDEYK